MAEKLVDETADGRCLMDKTNRLWTIAFFMAVLAGCAGKATVPNLPPEAPRPANPSTAALGVMSPGDALALIPDRTGSYLVLERNGYSFAATTPQRVSKKGASARFSPDWTDGNSGFEQLAFAIYSFRVQGYEGNEEVLLEWGEEPDDYSNLFIGLSQWGNNRWDWFPSLPDGSVDLNGVGYADYTKPVTGYMLVAIVMLGTEPALLDRLVVGREHISITGVTPPSASGFPGGSMTFDVQFYGDDDSASYNWDFGGGATPDTSIVRSPMVTLGIEGIFDCSVTVDNDYGDPDTFFFTLTVNESQQTVWPMFGHDPQHTRRSLYRGAQTGNLKWEFETSSVGSSYLDPITGPDGTVYVGLGNKLHALNPDGTLKWHSVDCNPGFRPALATDGTIYVSSKHGAAYWVNRNLYALNPDGSLKWTYVPDDFIT